MATQTTQGILLNRGNAASPEVFTSIGQITSLGDFGFERGLIDTTTLDSTAREYNLAIKDGVQFTAACRYDPANTGHLGLKDDLNNGTLRNFTITVPSSPVQTISFAARVMAWKFTELEVDNVMGLEVGLKVSGDITFS